MRYILLLTVLLASNAFLSPPSFSGGLKSILKEVSKAEKKLKDEGILDDNEDLYFSFKNGVKKHNMWHDGAHVVKVGEYNVLINPQKRQSLSGASEKEQKEILLENMKSIGPYIKFYESKPFKLEQMFASGACFQRQNVQEYELIDTYAKELISSHDSSDAYDERAVALQTLKKSGIKKLSLSALKFNPEEDMVKFTSLWESLDDKRPAVRKWIGNNRSLSKCYKLFKI